MTRPTALLPLLALAAPMFTAPAFASSGPQDVAIAKIMADPQPYVGASVVTDGYVLQKQFGSAFMGGTDKGMLISNALDVKGKATEGMNYYDRYRLQGVVEHSPYRHENDSDYDLRLTAPPQDLGH